MERFLTGLRNELAPKYEQILASKYEQTTEKTSESTVESEVDSELESITNSITNSFKITDIFTTTVNKIPILDFALFQKKLKIVPVIKYSSVQPSIRGTPEPIVIMYDTFAYCDSNNIIKSSHDDFFNTISFKFVNDADVIRPIIMFRAKDVECYHICSIE